jgi:hypothetical protein
MGYKITLTFNSDPSVDDKIEINDGTTDYFKSHFVFLRGGFSQVTIGDSISETITNLSNAFAIDYNSGLIFQVETTPTTFSFWSDTYFSGGEPVEDINTSEGRIGVTIEEIDAEFSIISTSFSGDCNNVDIEFTANYDINTLITTSASYTIDPPATSATIQFTRGLIGRSELITAQNDTLSEEDSVTVYIPSLLLSSMFTINQVVNPLSANITIENTTEGLTLEYSLNGTDYQSSPIFNNVVEDSYTLYVRDEFDCEIEIPFEVVLSSVTEPYFRISKSNALRFSKIETIDNCTTFANDENTLSCESWVNLPYKQKQTFKTCDTIRTQFRSAFETNEVQLLQNGVVVSTITPTKISNNIGLSQKIDAKIVSLGSNVYGVYFTSGNIYDYNTETVTGTYELVGELPEWAVIGNWVLIEGIFYQIDNITFNENFNAWQFEYTSLIDDSGDKIIGALWNNENYEIYEFSILCSGLGGDYTVKINCLDSIFDDIYHVSEVVNVDETQEGTLHIEYWNDENTDFFVTDWHHNIRVGFSSITPELDNESELFKGDDTATIYDVSNYEVNKFVFLPQTTEICRKIVLALSHKNVKINGVSYAKKSIDMESQGSTNLQVISASMIKSSGS